MAKTLRTVLDAAFQETRESITQDSLEENRLETDRCVTELEMLLGDAGLDGADGCSGPAPKLPQDPGEEERTFALPQAHQEVERLLADAARHCNSGKPSLAVQPLDEAKTRLWKLSKEGTSELYEAFLRLQDQWQSLRRPVLERFNVLRDAFIAKITARIGDERRLSRSDNPPGREILGNLLGQIEVAQGLLASLDPVVIGRQDYERAAGELGDLRGILIALLHESGAVLRSGNDGSPERASAASLPTAPSVVCPAPPSEEVLVLELSPWAMGSWGTLTGGDPRPLEERRLKEGAFP